MADAPRSDRLSRDELGRLQRKCLREWRESNWYAIHDPEGWTRLEDKDPARICVDLGSGVGESEQYPGYIALDKDLGDRRALQEKGEDRLPDLYWDLNDGLPFEDQSVDDVYVKDLLGELSEFARQKLPRELARVMAAAGCITIRDTGAAALATELEAMGFEEETPGRLVLTSQKRPMADVQPHLYDEHVLGQPVIPDVRMPYRR